MDTSPPSHSMAPTAGNPQSRATRKSQLSPQRQWLVEAMQILRHGRIEDLIVVNREPVPKPPPRIRPHHKLVGQRYRPGEILSGDFALKEQVVTLFEELDTIADGIITIIVKEGLPFDFF